MLFLHLTLANLKMIVRNRQALFWALAFPLVFVFIFALIGSFGESVTTVGVVDRADEELSRQIVTSLEAIGSFEITMHSDEASPRLDVENGDLEYLLVIPEGLASLVRDKPPVAVTVVYDATQYTGSGLAAIERVLDGMNLSLAGAAPRLTLSRETVLSDNVDFMEFVLPGLVLWGIMSNSVMGIAVALANYREKKILRRIKASPLRARTFFASLVSAYLVLSLVQAAMLFGIGSVVMGVSIVGNLPTVALLILVCNVIFLNLGFIVGAFSKTGAAASGLGNVIVLPLVMFSGIFFPPELLPDLVGDIMRFLPLAPMVEVLRAVTLSDRPVMDFPLELGLIAAWVLLTSLIATRVFRIE